MRDLNESELTPQSHATYRVGPALIDTASRQIRFDQQVAEVQPKVFDLIVFLIRHRDRVVSKDELFDAIWPSVVVGEASLTQLIKRARDLFRQYGFEQDVIRTVSRAGYQFAHPVDTDEPIAKLPAQSELKPVTWIAVAVIALLGLGLWNYFSDDPDQSASPEVSSNSIAVLPFSNLTPDPEFAYFTDGLTETVTNSLTRVNGLRVIASSSAFSLRDVEDDLNLPNDQLRVGHVVQGSVQRDGEDLRISARLVRVNDGTQLWSQLYSREFDDIFNLHDEISREIIEQMAGVLSASLALPDDAALITSNSDDSEAYRLLLEGQAIVRRGVGSEYINAETLFRQAVALKPDYADAIVALASAIRIRAVIGELPRESTFSEALVLLNQALDIDPQHVEALVEIGEIQHRHFWEFDDAASYYQRAIEASPGDASARSAYSRFLSKAGLQPEAVSEARVAIDLNPLSAGARSSLTLRLIRAGDLEAARQSLEAFKSSSPDHADIPWLETNWHIRNGSNTDALQWIALEELDYLRLSLSAMILNNLGRSAQAQEALDELIETDSEGAAFQIAEVYAAWEQADLAFEWFDRAFQQGDPGLAELYSSVNLGNLYGDPRFAALAQNIGLPAPPSAF